MPFFLHQNHLNHSSGYGYGQSGAGMGLTILKRYIFQANGKVWFANESDYEEGKDNLVKLHLLLPGA